VAIARVPDETADARLEKLDDLLPATFPDCGKDAGTSYAALELTKPGKPCSRSGIDRARLEARVPSSATRVPSFNRDVARDILIEGDNRELLGYCIRSVNLPEALN
jgi:hypothetical protein